MASETKRKLGSVQIIDTVTKHPNADSLEIITLVGMAWQVIEVLGVLQIGDKVVYCEIDSLLPGNASWLPEAVKKRVEKEWFRVKTIQLRKELSQGLVVKLSNFLNDYPNCNEWAVEDDVTDLLKLGKYEPNGQNDVKGLQGEPKSSNFPTHLVPKTDEVRVQSSPKLLTALIGNPYYISIKYDGMSATFLIDPTTNVFLVCSRNCLRGELLNDSCLTRPKEECAYWDMAEMYNIEQNLRNPDFIHYAIQGEVCGPKIQKNLLNLSKVDFFVFNVYDLRTKTRLNLHQMTQVCKEMGLKTVETIEQGPSFDYTIPQLLVKSEGKYNHSKHEREGIVVRSMDGGGGQVSFKVINNKYLLKNDY